MYNQNWKKNCFNNFYLQKFNLCENIFYWLNALDATIFLLLKTFLVGWFFLWHHPYYKNAFLWVLSHTWEQEKIAQIWQTGRVSDDNNSHLIFQQNMLHMEGSWYGWGIVRDSHWMFLLHIFMQSSQLDQLEMLNRHLSRRNKFSWKSCGSFWSWLFQSQHVWMWLIFWALLNNHSQKVTNINFEIFAAICFMY